MKSYDDEPTTFTMTLPKGAEPTLRIVPMPKDTNLAGNIFGGWILPQVDIAGSIPAIRRARARDHRGRHSVEFHERCLSATIVSCYAEVWRVGRTSLTVQRCLRRA